ncbi:MAG: SDH family Clp fold serine proteinase [Candidatus Nitrosotenuis sp.]
MKTKDVNHADEISKLVSALEQKRKSVVIPLLFTNDASLDRDTVTDIYNFLEFEKKLQNCTSMEVILNSSGGSLDAAIHLCEILRSYSNNLKFIVPRYAKSAATLVALSGDALVLDKPSELGPLDPIWSGKEEQYPAASLPKTIEFLHDMEKKLPKDSKIIEIIAKGLSVTRMGVYKASLEYSIPPLVELLTTIMFKTYKNVKKSAKKIATGLATGYPQHGYPVTIREAEKLGIRIERMTTDQWEIVWKIYKHFEDGYLR